MTQVTHSTGTIESWKRNGQKDKSSDDCRKLAGRRAERTWHGVAVRSRHLQQRPEKLGRRHTTTVTWCTRP